MKIYTKTGDKGQTSLIGGTRVPKSHERIEAYGTVDELNSYIGLLRDQPEAGSYKEQLVYIQDRLFTIGSLLAQDPEKTKMKLPHLAEEDILLLENEIDTMNESLPEMRSFVLPGGHILVSHTHIARCICRRAERCVIRLSYNTPVNDIIIKYLNRLSDYLFVLSRKFSHDLNAIEIPWVAKM
jgi:cob(I)alamin adenosyltransferase